MLPSSGPGKISAVGLMLLFVFFVASAHCLGAGIEVTPLNATVEKNEPQKLFLTVGRTTTLKFARPISRISEPDPNIATIMMLSPNEIYITSKGVGVTNLIIWQDNRAVVYDLEIVFDISRFKQRLYEILPDEKDLRVVAANDNITLSGRVSSTANLDQALSMAQSFAPKDKIRNLVEVAGVHQVMLEVRVAEMSKSDMKRLGFNMLYTIGSDFGISMLAGLTSSTYTDNVTPPSNLSPSYLFTQINTQLSSNVNALFRFGNNPTWTAMIDALQQDGVIKVLAEPTLITMSGQSANFLAGGEFPVPVTQDYGNTSISYKQYGVSLNFSPTVLSADRINIRVSPEVSDLDYVNSVTLNGFVVPGLAVRRATTTVELGDGQSFAIAGLLLDHSRENISKFPILGNIPILGMLFRSTAYQRNETELVIVVTPRLVKPSNQKKQPLPTDNYIEPTFMDMAFPEFSSLLNKEGAASAKGTLDGEFGSAAPKS
jgi:pilus assembly protein CpaC